MPTNSPLKNDARPHRRLWSEAALAGTLASVLSAVVLGWTGHREKRSITAPVNAVSHWWWGKPALRVRGLSVRHTLLGYAIHHGAALGWAALHALAVRGRTKSATPAALVAGAAATSAVACLVDFKCTPERFTPGFEHHLSRSALVGVYAAFALGLALAHGFCESRAKRGRTESRPKP